jgi:hypothetical protein
MRPAIRFALTITILVTAAFVAGSVNAQPFVDAVRTNCAKELKTYCSRVTQGEGRLAYCLLAYEDKLSRTCDATLLSAFAELGKILVARGAVVRVCDADWRRLCGGVKPGEGNILSCLKQSQKAVSPGCNAAIIDAKL